MVRTGKLVPVEIVSRNLHALARSFDFVNSYMYFNRPSGYRNRLLNADGPMPPSSKNKTLLRVSGS